MSGIRIENITKRYGTVETGFTAVRDVSLNIEPGELFFLLGPSGCGKTTLLRMIAGLIDPTQGRICLGDRDATHLPAQKRNTAMVFQNYALWPHMTIYQNVEFGPRMKGISRKVRRDRADRALALSKIDGLGLRKPNQLSGGQQQRVALARALAAESECLLLDEPLSNLDAQLRLLMRTELRRLIKKTGSTAVYVTHDQKEALSMADRIAVMQNGEVMQVGSPEELYNRPASQFVAGFLGEANFIEGTVVRCDDVIEVKTDAGQFIVDPAEAEVTIDQRVTCCVRPERIRLSAKDSDTQKPGELTAKVDVHTYLGEMRQYTCTLKNGASWRISAMGESVPHSHPQDRVLLRIDPDDVRILTR